MKNYLFLFCCFLLLGAAPSRPYNYESGKPMMATSANENESTLYQYLASGVDNYRDGSITNDDIANGANIQSEKLNLENVDKVRFSSSGKLVLPTKKERPATCEVGEIYLLTTLPAIEVCVAENSWAELK